MMEEILFRINFTLKVPPDARERVEKAFSVSFLAVLQALGCQDVEVLVQKKPTPYPNLEDEKKEG